jgi:hypothetical protein
MRDASCILCDLLEDPSSFCRACDRPGSLPALPPQFLPAVLLPKLPLPTAQYTRRPWHAATALLRDSLSMSLPETALGYWARGMSLVAEISFCPVGSNRTWPASMRRYQLPCFLKLAIQARNSNLQVFRIRQNCLFPSRIENMPSAARYGRKKPFACQLPLVGCGVTSDFAFKYLITGAR